MDGICDPAIRQRYSVVATGLTVGLLWGVWHFPRFAGTVPSAPYLAVLLFRGCCRTGCSWCGSTTTREPARDGIAGGGLGQVVFDVQRLRLRLSEGS